MERLIDEQILKETDEQRKERQKRNREEMAIMANRVAKQIVSIPEITFAGAFKVLDWARRDIEQAMKGTRATATPEPCGEFGEIIKTPRRNV